MEFILKEVSSIQKDINHTVCSFKMSFSVLYWVLNKISSRPGVDIFIWTRLNFIAINLDVKLHSAKFR